MPYDVKLEKLSTLFDGVSPLQSVTRGNEAVHKLVAIETPLVQVSSMVEVAPDASVFDAEERDGIFVVVVVVVSVVLKIGDVPLVEFMYLVFTRMPGERYRRRLGFLLLRLFRALINSLVCCSEEVSKFVS